MFVNFIAGLALVAVSAQAAEQWGQPSYQQGYGSYPSYQQWGGQSSSPWSQQQQ